MSERESRCASRHSELCAWRFGMDAACDCGAGTVFEVVLGDRAVTYYDTRREAQEAVDWYVESFGRPSKALTIREVECD